VVPTADPAERELFSRRSRPAVGNRLSNAARSFSLSGLERETLIKVAGSNHAERTSQNDKDHAMTPRVPPLQPPRSRVRWTPG